MNLELAKKTRQILAHHATLLAITLYFVNNHILQKMFPTWWTGKLSDFAWLFFFPIVMLFILVSVFPHRITEKKNFDTFVFLITGIVYSLVKTIPWANNVVAEYIGLIIRIPVFIAVDVTDLLALLALVTSYYFWRRFEWKQWDISFQQGLIIVSLATLLTLADAPQRSIGICCFEVRDNSIVASSNLESYISYDGGENWEIFEVDVSCYQRNEITIENAPYLSYDEHRIRSITSKKQITEVSDGNLKARFLPTELIEISTDGGKTWEIEYNPNPMTRSDKLHYEESEDKYHHYETGPVDAVIDPITGNIVFAMVDEGILIRTPEKEWQWVEIGIHRHNDSIHLSLYSLLFDESLLALLSGLLIFIILGIKENTKEHKQVGSIIFGSLSFLLILLAMFIFTPAIGSLNDKFFATLAIAIASAVLVVLGIVTAIRLGRNSVSRLQMLPYAGLGVVLFLLPYLMWYAGLLPYYYFASSLALITQIAITVYGTRALST